MHRESWLSWLDSVTDSTTGVGSEVIVGVRTTESISSRMMGSSIDPSSVLGVYCTSWHCFRFGLGAVLPPRLGIEGYCSISVGMSLSETMRNWIIAVELCGSDSS